MHRTQLYFDEAVLARVQQRARAAGVSVSAYIRELVRQDLEREPENKPIDLSEFSGLWEGRDIDQQGLRDKAWK